MIWIFLLSDELLFLTLYFLPRSATWAKHLPPLAMPNDRRH